MTATLCDVGREHADSSTRSSSSVAAGPATSSPRGRSGRTVPRMVVEGEAANALPLRRLGARRRWCGSSGSASSLRSSQWVKPCSSLPGGIHSSSRSSTCLTTRSSSTVRRAKGTPNRTLVSRATRTTALGIRGWARPRRWRSSAAPRRGGVLAPCCLALWRRAPGQSRAHRKHNDTGERRRGLSAPRRARCGRLSP